MKKKSTKLLSLLLAVMMLLTACAGGGGKTADKVQGVTDTEIVVGNSAATSGAYAPVGVPFNKGIEAYFKKINEEGGVKGRKIVFKHIDDEFAPDKGKAALTKLVEDEKVFAIVGHFGTPVVSATIEDLKEYGIPTVYFATGIGQLYNEKAEGRDRILFPVQPIYVTEGAIMVTRGVGDYKAKKVGIIYTNDDAGKDMLKGAEAKAKELGIEFFKEQVEPGATDVSAAVTSLLKNNPDFIIGGAIQQTFPTIVKALNEQGNKAPVITTYVNVAPVIAAAVADASKNFDILGNGWVSFTQESAVAELAEYSKWIEKDLAANAYAITGWIAAKFFVEGLNKIPEGTDITWNSYMDALEKEPIMNPFGGMIDFTKGLRQGTTVMNLSKVDAATLTKTGETFSGGWSEVYPLQSMEEILKAK
ncbi:ABC transporter substrate-binding protein [Peptoniphilaceae bacterium SGI.131]